MRDLRSYVVKVYRQQAGSVAGTVQEVRTGRTVGGRCGQRAGPDRQGPRTTTQGVPPSATTERLYQAMRVAPSP